MKFVTFETDGVRAPGVLTQTGDILDLRKASLHFGGPAFSDLISVIAAGPAGIEAIRSWLSISPAGCLARPADVRLKAPLPRPNQIRDFANYELHVRQAIASSLKLRANAMPDPAAALAKFYASGLDAIPQIWFDQPLYFKGNPMSVIGPDEDVIWPHYAKLMDYELELAVVIAGPARDLTRANAADAIFGYTIFNDFSARDAQARETQFRLGPAKGKDFDTGNAIGPVIVTRDEIPDPNALTMIARVNGEERVRTHAGGMQHSIIDTLVHVSQSETLYPGDVFGLGTVGNGCGYESLTFLNEGDLVELEIEGIGILRNRLVRHPPKDAVRKPFP
jgi:2-keto-4-pentenoate hydratase/2-oxohepta-3-ene-1,7-dioic acid hydratase in catechol pathway